jgi:N-methylhydantoinase A
MVIVPRVAALMSAFGMFAKDLGLEYARSCFRSQKMKDFDEVGRLFTDMRQQALDDFARIGIPASQLSFQPTVEMRYMGQYHEVEVELPGETLTAETLPALLNNFHSKYQRMYTYSMPWREAEFLTFRLKVTVPKRPVQMAVNAQASTSVETARRGARSCLFAGQKERLETPVYDWDRMEPGHKLVGPALIDDKTTTVLVVPGFTCELDAYRNLVLKAIAPVHFDRTSVQPEVAPEFIH